MNLYYALKVAEHRAKLKRLRRCLQCLVVVALMSMLTGCSIARFVPEGHYLLDKATIQSDSSSLRTGQFEGFLRQRPNTKWFNLIKVPILPYALSGTDSTKRFNRFMWRVGENPVIEDTLATARTMQNIQAAAQGRGYLNASVEVQRKFKKHKVRLNYLIHNGPRYTIGLIEEQVDDSRIDSVIHGKCRDFDNASNIELHHQHHTPSRIRVGMPFDANTLDSERSRITSSVQNHGYYYFNRDYVRFEADTTEVPLQAWLKMYVNNPRLTTGETVNHQQYKIGHVEFEQQGGSHLRKSLLNRMNHLQTGTLYCERDVNQTYSALNALDAVLGSNISFQPCPEDSSFIDARVRLTTNKPHSVSAELEGTNSAGDLGAAVALSYQNCNLFHGSEVLSLKARGAFEAIKGLDGYDDQNYLEFSMEATLKFPDFLLPFLNHDFRRQARATSELTFMYDNQNRPEFHRRVLTAAWRYRWRGNKSGMRHRIDLADLNYVFMPWISSTFKRDYLDNPTSRNAILRYNYENLFIMKWGYVFTYSTLANGLNTSYGTNAYQIRFGVETSGNLLRGISALMRSKPSDQGHYEVFNIAYAQYAKLDFDFSKSLRLNDKNSFAFHVGLGVAVPYGNSSILPYEKRYFSGGANSVRGWSVRGLGPGSFKGTDGRIDFINQTGDLKFDMNVEYRTHLFWKIDGAAFVDAGNIWTLRHYDEQPGGQFDIRKCWSQIAVAYGLGIRLNFNFFILRLDGGMKAINPAYDDARRHYPVIHPNFGRDFTFHFAVGLPF